MTGFALNDRVEDIITGFHGLVVGITLWLNGCKRLGIQSPNLNKDGIPRDVVWFDDSQCKLIRRGSKKPLSVDEETGGPRQDPTRSPDPS